LRRNVPDRLGRGDADAMPQDGNAAKPVDEELFRRDGQA